ncbi:hypothetical protein RRG08_038695 [Elysia crispata]|uniref:Uncharacterized protein n=1 Tax=Elysia crispata TaxID=231223 RepID=A0AAE0ZIQ4_9GAST|nr:hypothetical protein RRG08_038695 [Elysia crispata]
MFEHNEGGDEFDRTELSNWRRVQKSIIANSRGETVSKGDSVRLEGETAPAPHPPFSLRTHNGCWRGAFSAIENKLHDRDSFHLLQKSLTEKQ